jgi:hypothetical protein
VCHCCELANPANAARAFTKPAAVLLNPQVIALIRQRSRPTIVEYGAGSLRNALHLQARGCRVTVIELPEAKERFPEQYQLFERRGGRVHLRTARGHNERNHADRADLALLTFVLETVCERAVRIELLKDCRARMKKSAALILALRGPAGLNASRTRSVRCSDGILTSQRTFVRAFTARAASRMLREAGFSQHEFLNLAPTPRKPRVIHVIARP